MTDDINSVFWCPQCGRGACATGRDAQTVTVRRGHLRWLLAEYDRAVGVSVSPLVRAERGCMGCAHAGCGSDCDACDACDYPEWPHWEPRVEYRGKWMGA